MKHENRRPLTVPLLATTESINRQIAIYLEFGESSVLLQAALIQEGFLPLELHSLEELVWITDEDFPVAIIVDLGKCLLDVKSGEVLSQLRCRFSPPRPLYCIACENDIPARLQAVRLGATRCIRRPFDVGRLITILKGVTAQTPIPQFKALLIDVDRKASEHYAIALNDDGVSTMVISDPLQAPALINEVNPDVIISEVYLPGCNGLELLAMIRQDDELADTPVILLSSAMDTRCQRDALYFGADDFLFKPVDERLFVATVIARAKRARMLKRIRGELRGRLERILEMERYFLEITLRGREIGVSMNAFFPWLSYPEDYSVHELH